MRKSAVAYWIFILISLTGLPSLAAAQTYWLDQSVVNCAGNTYSGSGKNLLDSVGEPLAGQTWGTAFSIQAGFFNEYYMLAPTPTVTPTVTVTPTLTTTATQIRSFNGELLDINWVYAAPNPIRGTRGNIYFDLAETADVDLKIYTAMNQLVISQHWSSITAGHNQWIWNAGNIANGVYILFIKASKDGKTTIIKKKIALVK